MSVTLFWANLKSSRWSLIGWGGAAFALAVIMVSVYPSMKQVSGYQSFIQQYLESLPEQIRAIYGTEEITKMFSAEGVMGFESYLSLEYVNWWPIILAIFAVFFTGGAIAREVEKGTMDLLLSQPVPRYRVVVSKYAGFLATLFWIIIASVAGVFIAVALNDIRANSSGILLAFLQGGILVAAVGSYSLLCSCLFFDPRRALTVAGLLTVVLYMLNPLGAAFDALKWARNLSLFHHFEASKIMTSGQLDWTGTLIFLAIAVLGFGIAIAVFQKKDLLI